MTFGPKNTAFEYMSGNAAATAKAKTAVVGKTFVSIVAGGNAQLPNVETATAGSVPFGLASWDAAPTLDEGVVTVQRRGVWSVTAGEAIAAGDSIAVGADGKAVKAAAAVRVGYAREAAVTGADVAVDLAL